MFEERNKKRAPTSNTNTNKALDGSKSSGLKAEEASR